MRLLLHIVAKDFRELRDRWLFWVGAMALKTAVALWLVWGPGVNETVYDYLCKSLLVLVPMEFALTFLLAAMIVQADPLAGEAPFWRTRPVSGRRLLGAKLLGLFLLLGLPVCLVALPWWLACGAGPAELASVAALMLLMQAAVIAPAVLVASLTESLGQFFVWSLVLVPAHAFGGLIGPMAAGRSLPAGGNLTGTRLALYFSVMVITGAVVITLQFLHGNRRRSLTVLGGGWALAVAGWLWWPWPMEWSNGSQRPGRPEPAAGVKVEIAGVRFDARQPKSKYENLYVRLRLGDETESGYLTGRRSEHSWTWADDSRLRRNGWGAYSMGQMIESVQRELKLDEPAAAAARRAKDPDSDRLTVGLSVSPAEAAKLRSAPSRYELTLDLVRLRPRPALEMPLAVAGWRTDHGQGARVLQIAPGTPKRPGSVAYLHTEFPGRLTDWFRAPFIDTGPNYGAVELFWVDRATRRIKPLGPRQSAIRWAIAGVTTSLPVVSIDQADLADDRGFSLAWIDWERGEPFSRTVAVERLEVK
jgi:hypothetical protein